MVFIHGAFSAVLYVFLFLVLLPSFVASSESSTATTSTRELLFFGWKEDTCGAKWWWSGAAASCVCSAEELRQRIALAASTDAVENSVIVNPTQISLCHNSHIVLDSEIDLTDKAIALQCGTTSAIFGSLGGLLRSSCIVDGNHRTRLFSGSNAQVSLHGITFINGFVPAPTSWPTEYMDRGGAAIKLKDSIVTMDRCEFSNHDTPTGPGGAIAVQGGSIRVSSSTLTENSAMVGGALAALDARVHTVQTRFWANRAREGGASSFQGGSVILEKTVVFQNSATAGVRFEISVLPCMRCSSSAHSH